MAGDHEAYARALDTARRLSGEQDWKAAVEAYKQALLEFPQDVTATLELGNAFVQLGHFQAALKTFQRAVQLAPQNARAWLSLADVQERSGLLSEAAASYVAVGDLLAQQGDLEQASDAWRRASRLTPGQTDVYKRLARTLEQLGHPTQAATEYVTLAAVYERRDMPDLAVQYYRRALRLDPGHDHAQARLRILEAMFPSLAAGPATQSEPEPRPTGPLRSEDPLLDLENLAAEDDAGGHSPFDQTYRQALQELADIVFTADETTCAPVVVSAINQALDQRTRGATEEAIKSMRRALDNGLTRTALFYTLGALYRECQQYDNAIQAFRHCMRDQAYTLGSHYALGLTYQAAGKIDRALEHFMEVVKAVDLASAHAQQAEQLTTAYQQLTDSYVAKADTQKAKVFIQTLTTFFAARNWERKVRQARRDMDNLSDGDRVMTLAEYLETPETEIIVTTLGLTAEYMRRNMLMTATEECLHAIEKVPDHLPLHTRLADILLMQEHTEQAINKYLAIAEVYEVRGELRQAVEICHKVLRAAPMDVQARQKLVALLLRLDETEQALEHCLALADTHYRLAQVAQALEAYGAALNLASRSANRQKWEIQALHRMADIFSQRVDWARATAAYESIVAISPDDEAALTALVDLYYKQGQKQKALLWLDRLLVFRQTRNQLQQAVPLLQELVQAYPGEMGLHARLAAAYSSLGMRSEAVAEYDRLGRMQLKAGLPAEAARTLEAIINLAPPNVEEYRRLLAQVGGIGH